MHTFVDSINQASIAFAKLGSAMGDRTYYILEQLIRDNDVGDRWVACAGGPMWWLQSTFDRAQPSDRFRLALPKAVV